MPPPSHRLDLLLLPPSPGVEAAGAAPLIAAWEARGWLSTGEALVEGGAARVWLDLPGGETLYANQQGGFRVGCPARGASVVPAFQRAVGAWRQGGPRQLACPACGEAHDLDALAYAPPAGIARGAVVLSDVQALEPRAAAREALAAVWGGVRVVWRRMGR